MIPLNLAHILPFADQAHPVLSWVLAGLAVLVVGIAKSGFGGGVGIAAIPLMVFAFDNPADALATLLPILIAADALSVYHHWGTWDRFNLKVIAPGTLLGLCAGSVLLWLLVHSTQGQQARQSTEDLMKLTVGVICVLYVLADLVRSHYAPNWYIRADFRGGTITGMVAGVVSTLAHAAGPITAIYWIVQRLPKQRFIGTAAIYYFVLNTLKLVPYALFGLLDTQTITWGLWLLPLAPVGTYTGTRMNRIISEKLFRVIVYSIVLLSGIQFILRFAR